MIFVKPFGSAVDPPQQLPFRLQIAETAALTCGSLIFFGRLFVLSQIRIYEARKIVNELAEELIAVPDITDGV